MACHKAEKDDMDYKEAINAFVAMGGYEDGTGEISTDKLIAITKEFGLTIDIEAIFSC